MSFFLRFNIARNGTVDKKNTRQDVLVFDPVIYKYLNGKTNYSKIISEMAARIFKVSPSIAYDFYYIILCKVNVIKYFRMEIAEN